MRGVLGSVLAVAAAVVAGVVALRVLGIISPRADPAVASMRAELKAERDSTAAWRVRAAAAAAEAARLREDSARVYRGWGVAQEAATAGVWAIRELAAQARARGDRGTGERLEGAATAVEAEQAGCSLVVLNCEARAANADTARADAAARVDSLAFQLDTLGVRWEDAEKRARPNFFRDLWRTKEVTGPLLVILVLLGLSK
jgi:hypothetical protein